MLTLNLDAFFFISALRLVFESIPTGVAPGEITPSYILHTRAFGTYLLGGLFPLQKKYKVMVFYM